MSWKLDHAELDRHDRQPAPSGTVPEPSVGEAFPTPGDVFGEMAVTIAVFLAIALVMHVLFDRVAV
ncbi:hypothetical protein [Azospirillum doebereinerae]|uniref:Uncharacterized protein n=1 Tax=Azospirillum doebereinerae TaxID=92933 RepID=A0A433J6I9_9PROT|nr:hypothetical protein [Azospirillum doebereinerae]MCG5239399.1 hypothetical protein [Azospirillum doebereinerae]RUQ68550.1 hypothetical protein EJ913_18215 [Azospirillum doebereinerae]